jgi:hypothetical protein
MAIKPQDYVQTDDFAQMNLGDKIDYVSKHNPVFAKMDPGNQRKFIYTKTKQIDYKPRDIVSKTAGFLGPLIGQIGLEVPGAAGGAALGTALVPGAGTMAGGIAGASAMGGLGAALGSSAVDYMDYKRGMGPKPSVRSELKQAPSRMAYGAAGSLLGAAAPRFVNPKTGEGFAEALGNPRYYTRMLGKLGKGTEETIEKAAGKGEESVAKYEADAINKVKQVKEEMAAHWKDKKYGDPVVSDFELPEKPDILEFKKKYGAGWSKPYSDAVIKYEKGAAAPAPTSNSLQSIYNRYMNVIRKKGKMPVEEEVPELVRIKRLAQSKERFDSRVVDPEQKLTDDDFRRIGKITNGIDERLETLDPKQKALELKLHKAYQDRAAIQSDPVVKEFGRNPSERFSDRFSGVTRTKPVRGKVPEGEQDFNRLRQIELESGIPFTEDLTRELAGEHFNRNLASNSSMWQKRMGIAAPMVVGSAAATGKVPPSYLSAMSALALFLSPRAMKHVLTTLPRYGPQAIVRGIEAANEPDRE